MRKWILMTSTALLLLSACEHETTSKSKTSTNTESHKVKKNSKKHSNKNKDQSTDTQPSPDLNNQQNHSFASPTQQEQAPSKGTQPIESNQVVSQNEFENNDDQFDFYYYDHYGRTPEQQRAHERWINDQRRFAEEGKFDVDVSQQL